jgi:hypothetical protein
MVSINNPVVYYHGLTPKEFNICRKGSTTNLFSPPPIIYIYQINGTWEGTKGRGEIHFTMSISH